MDTRIGDDRIFQRDSYEEVPVGIYVVAPDGTFIRCNRRAREILRVSEAELSSGRCNILRFYKNPDERARLLRLVTEAEEAGTVTDGQVVSFSVGGEDIYIKMICSSLRDPVKGGVVGYLGCIMDVTAEERYRQLLNLLSEGVYQVDGNDTITYVNEATARLFGYPAPESMVGLPLAKLFFRPDDVQALRQLVNDNEQATAVWEVVRANHTPFFASITALGVPDTEGGFAGYEGTIRDVTLTEQYRHLLDHLPVGYYMVHVAGGENYVSSCNREFANIFGYESEAQVVGMRVKDLHADTKRYDQFVKLLLQADNEGKALIGQALETRTHDGRMLVLEVSTKLLRDHSLDIIGWVGVVRDITSEAPLRLQIEELTHDIGNVLHTYSATLQMLQTSISPTIPSLARNTGFLPTEAHFHSLYKHIAKVAKEVAQGLGLLMQRADANPRIAGAIPEQQWEDLKRLAALLEYHESTITQPEFLAPTLRGVAAKAYEILDGIGTGVVERSASRQLLAGTWALERLCCLVALLRSREAILTMDYQTRSLREFVTQYVRPEETITESSIASLLNETISNVVEFARVRGITIRRKGEVRGATVQVVERDFLRALGNLLHNAVKYSWTREGGESAWVDVRSEILRASGRSMVRIEIENYGVPIPEDEISSGVIFRLGFRGRLASDRRRTGTGVGLADAKRVVERHGGEINIASRPARLSGRADNYEQPFITTATVLLPISSL